MSSGDGFGKNVIIFGADNSSSAHANTKKNDILIPGEVPTDGLDDTTITAEAKYSLNFTEQENLFLSLHYSGSNSFLFVNGVKICQFKTKDKFISIVFG